MEGCTIKRWYKSKVMTQIFETFGYIDLTALVYASPNLEYFCFIHQLEVSQLNHPDGWNGTWMNFASAVS